MDLIKLHTMIVNEIKHNVQEILGGNFKVIPYFDGCLGKWILFVHKLDTKQRLEYELPLDFIDTDSVKLMTQLIMNDIHRHGFIEQPALPEINYHTEMYKNLIDICAEALVMVIDDYKGAVDTRRQRRALKSLGMIREKLGTHDIILKER